MAVSRARHTTAHRPSGGELTIDPTENVKALTEAANTRQDDLRELNDRRIDAEIRIMEVQVGGLEKIAVLRAKHAKEIRDLESRRLDAIRQVDVTAVKTEAERALAAISVLATTTATNAENLRNALTATAQTIATQTANTVSQITERIAALEKSSYEGAGKQAVADPMQAEMFAKMERVLTAMAGSSGQSQGQKNIVAYISVGISILLGLLLLADRFAR